MNANDIAHLPPVCGEHLSRAAKTLDKLRKVLDESGLPLDWKHWLCRAVADGLPVLDEEADAT